MSVTLSVSLTKMRLILTQYYRLMWFSSTSYSLFLKRYIGYIWREWNNHLMLATFYSLSKVINMIDVDRYQTCCIIWGEIINCMPWNKGHSILFSWNKKKHWEHFAAFPFLVDDWNEVEFRLPEAYRRSSVSWVLYALKCIVSGASILSCTHFIIEKQKLFGQFGFVDIMSFSFARVSDSLVSSNEIR